MSSGQLEDRVTTKTNLQVELMKTARARTTFNVEQLTNLIYGGAENVRLRREAWDRVEAILGSSDTSKLPPQYARTSREEQYLDGLRMGKAAWDDRVRYGHDFFDWTTPRYTLCNSSPFGMAATMFAKTLELMATKEQQERWLGPTLRGEINGAYVQTELGHGTFVRGLETTATFEPSSDCFILHSPTLTSTKFWPGSVGLSATHGIVMARLITRGTDHGIHPFMVQLRDKHSGIPTQGVELGDLGPKPSYNQTDNGYARFSSVVIPRTNMLMGLASVSRDGTYKKQRGVHPKAAYACMLIIRCKMGWVCALQLAAAVTIAVRYSTVRQQGRSAVDDGSESGPELPIIQYKSQHYRLLSSLARAYAILFASWRSIAAQKEFQRRQEGGDFGMMADVHAMSAGLKAWASATAAEGAEDARKACGGAGYVVISGLPEIVQSVTVLCTLEGENYVLWQQAARYLLRWATHLVLAKNRDDFQLPDQLQYLSESAPSHCDTIGTGFLEANIQLAIFKRRARRLILKGESLLRRDVLSGSTMTHAWNEHMMLLISAAKAHTEYIVLEAFVHETEKVQDKAVRASLNRLRSLFALTAIMYLTAHDAIAFAEDGYLSSLQFENIRIEINRLLDELLGDAIGLTDAWDLTDAGLGSAIGMKDGNAYEMMMNWTKQLPINFRAQEEGSLQIEGWEGYVKPALRARL